MAVSLVCVCVVGVLCVWSGFFVCGCVGFGFGLVGWVCLFSSLFFNLQCFTTTAIKLFQ